MTGSIDTIFMFPVRSIQLREQDILQLGDFGFSVQKVQQEYLIRLGFYDGPIDGYLSPETENAIRLAQLSLRLDVTGQCDLMTTQALQSRSALSF
ncbi:MAG: peptidoglycan-binding protein [Limnothrix sp. RL_2_0]|nr:peptidoglycan-binding protein [Limnothrix sp. RL_2_0]